MVGILLGERWAPGFGDANMLHVELAGDARKLNNFTLEGMLE